MTVAGIICYCVLLLIAGYQLPNLASKTLARTLGWMLAIATVCLSAAFANDTHAVVRMTVIVFMQLLSMKVLVAIESYPQKNRLTVAQWTAFSLGWFGMNPKLFERFPGSALRYRELIFKGLSGMITGVIILYVSFIASEHPPLTILFIPQLTLLTGISLILHFGILNLSAAWWRFWGVDAPELFRAPYRARSLKEFWGRRWNAAFSEMTALIAYRPLKRKLGERPAIMLSFMLSGALHEIAVSFHHQFVIQVLEPIRSLLLDLLTKTDL